MHFPWSSLVNFLILVGILAYYLREPLKAFVRTRHEFLRDEVVRVEEQLRSAQHKFNEFSAKLKAVDAEVAAIHEQMRQEAEASRTRLVNEAKHLAQTLVADASATTATAVQDLKDQLRKELADQVVARAEILIRERLTETDHHRLRKEFSQRLGGVS